MAQNSKISWCHHTVNLWWGCSKVHTGCKNCYAEFLADNRFKKQVWGEHAGRSMIKSAFADLDRYQKIAEKQDIKFRVFCGSMMDIFEHTKALNNPSDQFFTTNDLRLELFRRISNYQYNNLNFLFLTKQPENIRRYIPMDWHDEAPDNVWFGTSISDQPTADTYTTRLQQLKNHSLFLSVEPQVNTISNLDLTGISWVIQGGESGQNKRPFALSWAYSMKEHCEANKVPYFFKQIDNVQPIPDALNIRQYPNKLK